MVEEKNSRKTRRVYITLPERVFEEMRDVGLLRNLDVWLTNIIMDTIEAKKLGGEENGRRSY